jgi:hypothetical protein
LRRLSQRDWQIESMINARIPKPMAVAAPPPKPAAKLTSQAMLGNNWTALDTCRASGAGVY